MSRVSNQTYSIIENFACVPLWKLHFSWMMIFKCFLFFFSFLSLHFTENLSKSSFKDWEERKILDIKLI